MKELVIVSGKGGTGKTSLTAAFAGLSEKMVLCDADVDAADLHLIMNPDFGQATDFMAGYEARIDPDRCTGCGRCLELCRFDAVRPSFEIDPIACEGCGVCVDLCPETAIDFNETCCGQMFVSNTRFGAMVHARLGIAQENSGKLVSQVRQEARQIAQQADLDFILTDGPPGIGCPVIASLGQASAVLIVSEPTVSGLHDMERVADLAGHFKIPAMVCINKCDLNPEQTKNIAARSDERGMAVVGQIAFDPMFIQAMVEKKTILEYAPDSESAVHVRKIWHKLMSHPVFTQLEKSIL